MTGGLSLTPQTAASAGPALSCDLAVQTLDVTSLDTAATPGAWVAAAAEHGPRPGPGAGPRGSARVTHVSVTRTFLAWYRTGLATALAGVPAGRVRAGRLPAELT